MNRYIDQFCPCCGEKFTDKDDIVVCPDCGTPHHRSCWQERGECANTSLHALGFEWKNPTTSAPKEADKLEENGKIRCSVCGTLNNPESSFCINCGHKLEPKRTYSEPTAEAGPMGRINNEVLDSKIDGVPIRDYLVYLGRNSLPYVMSFKRQYDTGSKIGFNFGALISPVLYFMYYRMWALASVMLGMTMALNTPSFIGFFMEQAEIAVLFGLNAIKWEAIGQICTYIDMALCVACAVFGTYLLRRHSTKKIKAIRRSCSSESEYVDKLIAHACPSKGFIIVLIIVISIMLLGLFVI